MRTTITLSTRKISLVQPRNSPSTALFQLLSTITICILISVITIEQCSATQQKESSSTHLQSTELMSRDGGIDSDFGGNGWLARVLRELFDDIDWQAIEKAREQVEKFVRKVDRLIKSFRGTNQQQQTTTAAPYGQQQEEEDYNFDGLSSSSTTTTTAGGNKEPRVYPQGKWWSSGGGAKLAGTGSMPAMLAGQLPGDASDVKAMLERVACFLGYMRILTDSNQALAELDAAKVVSNLFGATGSSKGGGYWKKWFG